MFSYIYSPHSLDPTYTLPADRFERYPEDDATVMYGLPALDPYGDEFPDFSYTLL